jgi:hypothetical protein
MSDNQMLRLPPISLSELPEATKDYVIALCNQHRVTPEEALKMILDNAAARSGFAPASPVIAA